ncbi:MAG TPA: DEAD/DEAH box helicase [Candidatus Baltobacteraceae bacterium]|nr:DEAD/DEAH box helicase [Candidatus Baltobacteraceae bacterium]
MIPPQFDGFFQAATGNTPPTPPYGYQCRLACGPNAVPDQQDSLRGGTTCRSQLINIPTGLGKTAAVVLAWLWNRIAHPDIAHRAKWPRRLVYCLPMRTLVEQTRDETEKWLKAHDLLWDGKGSHEGKVGLHILMGGEDSGEWDIHPEHPAILIGTQDMLLSRALNRGYGMSRYRWPMHFGLLNNDCLWVMDETQLMGPGLSTACQLEAFRNVQSPGCGAFGAAGSVTWYMSATSNLEHLKTREWRDAVRPPDFEFGLTPAEKAATTGPIHQCRFAVKQLELESAASFADLNTSKSLVMALLKRHDKMLTAIADNPKLPARTLIICSTVDHAVAVHALLAAEKLEGCDLLLLHSRFRPPERSRQMERLKATDLAAFPKGQIVVATQVIEAGVDVSSAILCSEIAPLASLVQRLGRLNRAGEFQNSAWKPVAIIVGVGVESESTGKNEKAKQEIRNANAKRCLPYELPACDPECKLSAWESLRKLNGNASSANLEQIQEDIAASIPRCPYSLQRHELADFFDTDANLSLGFTDVSPFVRGLDEDTDLQVCWREAWSEDGGPPDFSPDYQRDELCSVPISKWRYDVKAREVLNRGWLWRGKESGWISVRDAGLAPGMTILLPLLAGGYDNAAGWTGDKADNKHSSHYEPGDETSDEEQLSCLANGWRTIAAHTAEVASELDALLRHLLAAAENEQERNALIVAVPWHDIGKNHPGWQQAVLSALEKAGLSGKDAFRPFAKFSLSEMCSSRPNTAACSIRCSRNSPTLAARNRFATRRYARQSQHQTSPAGVCLPAGEKSPPPAAMFFAPFPARTISALPICGRAGPPISPRIHRTLRRTWWTRSFPPK